MRQLEARAAALDAKIVPRPIPGQYQGVVDEVQRFLGAMGSLDRILSLLHRLQVHGNSMITSVLLVSQ